MTTLIETRKTVIDLNAIADADAIQERFMQCYPEFMQRMKCQAVMRMLPDEVKGQCFSSNPRFVEQVIARVEDSALIEKANIYLSVPVCVEA